MKTEHEILTGVLAAQEDPDAADALIRQYMPFIKVQAAKVTHRIPHEEDDAMSIAMFAFHEAVMRYEKSRGAFLKYAAMAIRSRLIDYQRREKKHSGLISLDMPSGEEDDRSLAESAAEADADLVAWPADGSLCYGYDVLWGVSAA